MKKINLENHYRKIIKELGEDPEREGLIKTPERVAKSMKFLMNGYDSDPDAIMNQALFHEEYSEMVLVKDIEVYSLCEHHMLPFFGKAHIAYIPDGKIVGLSKVPRIVDAYARRLQVQERLTIEIRDCLQKNLNLKELPWFLSVHICACKCVAFKNKIQQQRQVHLQVCFYQMILQEKNLLTLLNKIE